MCSCRSHCLRMSDVGSLDGKFWEFTADFAKGDTAYTNIALGAHTDNTYFVRRHKPDPAPSLNDVLDTSDRSLRTTTIPPSLSHRRIRRRNAPSRRILRCIDLKRPPPRTMLSPLHHPDSSTRGRGRNDDLPAFTEIWVPGFESRSCN